MKKIMFDDKFGLTKAVLEGRKTMTRRLPDKNWRCVMSGIAGRDLSKVSTPYKVGEVVAVAQNYEDVYYGLSDREASWFLDTLHQRYDDKCARDLPAWRNKEFILADLMPHRIRITNVRVERMQDISDEDCIREGIEEDSPYYWVPVNMSLPNWRKIVEGVSDMYPNDRDGKVYPHFWDSPRKAFAALIDKLSGKGTWESNPWVFVYEFELLK